MMPCQRPTATCESAGKGRNTVILHTGNQELQRVKGASDQLVVELEFRANLSSSQKPMLLF